MSFSLISQRTGDVITKSVKDILSGLGTCRGNLIRFKGDKDVYLLDSFEEEGTSGKAGEGSTDIYFSQRTTEEFILPRNEDEGGEVPLEYTVCLQGKPFDAGYSLAVYLRGIRLSKADFSQGVPGIIQIKDFSPPDSENGALIAIVEYTQMIHLVKNLSGKYVEFRDTETEEE